MRKSIRIKRLIFVLMASGIIASCADSRKTTTTASSGATITSGLSAVNDKLTNAAAVIDSGASLMGAGKSDIHSRSNSIGLFAPPSFGTVWVDATGVQDMYDGAGTYSPKEWFKDQFNPDFVNDNDAKVTFSGRVANALDLICFLAELNFSADSTGLPKVGTHTGTLTSAMATECGDAGAAGEDLVFTVTATTDTTLYDRNISVDMGNACPFLFKIRMNSVAINIATAEDQSCDSRDQASSAVILYNKTADTLRFTYISQAFSGTSGFEFYRGYYNAAADTAYIMGINASDDTNDNTATGLSEYIAYSVVGKPEAGGTVAVSAKIDTTNINDETIKGCINASTLASETDDTLACTITGVDITAPFTDVIVATRAANIEIDDLYGITETQSVGFTDDSDMYQ